MEPVQRRDEPGWLARSIEEARAWMAKPKNRKWAEEVRANLTSKETER